MAVPSFFMTHGNSAMGQEKLRISPPDSASH
jgi:hypothetical protein